VSFFSGEIAWRGGDRKFASRVVEEREREREEIALVINFFCLGKKKEKVTRARVCTSTSWGKCKREKRRGKGASICFVSPETIEPKVPFFVIPFFRGARASRPVVFGAI